MSRSKSQPEAVSRLFLSCDLTGSTAFKQRPLQDPQAPWQKVFLQFYREFPQTLRLVQADSTHADAAHLRFELWKPVGDELIFTCELGQETDVFEAISVWTDTMAEYKRKSLNGEVLKETGGLKLGVKGGAFIATFPGPDSESSIPRRPDVEKSGRDVVALNREALLKKKTKRIHADYLFDYFGPSIDTGFRVLGLCSARHFALSLEVAFVLSSLDQMSTAKPYKSPSLTLLRGAELRGVWGGRRYPVFALDLEASDPINQAFRPFEQPSDQISDILKLCESCYTSQGWPFRVYLPNAATSGHFSVLPDSPLSGYVEEDGADAVPDDSNPTAAVVDGSAPFN